MVDYLYTRDYEVDIGGDDDSSSLSETTRQLVFHAKMYVLADDYGIESLRTLAKTKFNTYAGTIKDIAHLLEAVPVVFGQRRASAAPLQVDLVAIEKEHMKKSKFSKKYEIAIAKIAAKGPEFLAAFFVSVWADDFSRQCTCGSRKGNFFFFK